MARVRRHRRRCCGVHLGSVHAAQSTALGLRAGRSRLCEGREQAAVELRLLGGAPSTSVPFVWRLVEFQTDPLLLVHVLLGAVAWLALAWQMSRVLHHAVLRVAIFTIVLLLALSAQVSLWDWLAGSESLSFTFGALGIATAIGWARRPQQWWRAVALMLIALLFSLTRGREWAARCPGGLRGARGGADPVGGSTPNGSAFCGPWAYAGGGCGRGRAADVRRTFLPVR